MKIGTVCDLTKLSDRTVRYYIEENLISPGCTQNYLGRKSFDFSDADVRALRNIAILRKYDFSVEDIRTILQSPEASCDIVATLCEKKQQTLQNAQTQLSALQRLEQGRAYTVEELAQTLDHAELEQVELREEPQDYLQAQAFRFWFWCICGPAILFAVGSALWQIWEWSKYVLYAKYYPDQSAFIEAVAMLLLPLLLGAAMLVVSRRSIRRRKRLHLLLTGLLLVLCVLFVPYCTFFGAMGTESFPPFYSETEDPANYLRLGQLEREDRHIFLLFPEKIPESAMPGNDQLPPDTTRYYNRVTPGWNDYYEVLAQWQLPQDQLKAEEARILEAFSHEDLQKTQSGGWTYWCIYGADPWGDATDCCYYAAFAYHAETGVVRYIVASVDGDTPPAFMTLDWE